MHENLNTTLEILFACGFVQALNEADLVPLSEYEQETLEQEISPLSDSVKACSVTMLELLDAAEVFVDASQELSKRVSAREDKFEIFLTAARQIRRFHLKISSKLLKSG